MSRQWHVVTMHSACLGSSGDTLAGTGKARPWIVEAYIWALGQSPSIVHWKVQITWVEDDYSLDSDEQVWEEGKTRRADYVGFNQARAAVKKSYKRFLESIERGDFS